MESVNQYFKIPFTQKKESVKEEQNLHIVGIIDASGSMCSWWKWIADFYNTAIPTASLHTICFDHRVKVCPTNKLSDRIQDHGGGRTAIPEVFMEFEKHLQTINKEKNITVLFISDGQDNNQHSLAQRMKMLKGNNEERNINFICLGIKSGFPTFLSMRLRQLYHRGDEAIPALYLVEYVSEKAFFNKFEGIKKYFYSSGSVKLDPPVQVFPWDETVVDTGYEGSWVIVQSNEVLADGIKYKVQKSDDLNVEDIVEIFRGWVQQLQLVSLNDMGEAQQFAQIALKEMKQKIENLNNNLKQNVLMKLEEQNNKIGDSFCLRAKKNYIIRYGSKLQWFLDEIEQLAKGQSPKFDDQFEAAKRMNIGTITGKYQQKALALKNIPVAEFQKYIHEFVKIYQQTKLSDDGNSIKKIFMQEDFLKGISYIRNQFDFVEMFEVFGLGIKLKRTEKTTDNIYDCESRLVLKREVDFPSIIQKDFKIDFKGGDNILFNKNDMVGQDLEAYEGDINSIVPFFSLQKDSDLIPLMNTRLMQFYMTYLITQNADISMEDGYLNVIGQYLQLIFVQKNIDEELKQQQLQKCYESLKVFYGENKNFQQSCTLLRQNPDIYLKNHMKEHMLKIFTLSFYVLKDNQFEKEEQKQKVLEMIYYNFFYKLMANNENNINNLLKPSFTEQQKIDIKQRINEKLPEYFSISQFRKDFSIQFEEILKKTRSDVNLPKKFLYGTDENEIALECIEKMSADLAKKPFEMYQYSHILKHISENIDFYEVEMKQTKEIVNNYVYDKINQNNIKFFPGFSVLFKECEDLYSNTFLKNHWGIKPINVEQVKKMCQEKGYDEKKLEFSVSGLLKNACCAQNCQFFLQPRDDLDKHLAGWKGKVPRGFHRFIQNRLEMTTKQLLKDAKKKWGNKFPGNFDIEEQYAIQYIKDTLEAYQLNKYGKVKQDEDNEEQKKEEVDEEQKQEDVYTDIGSFVKKNWKKMVLEQIENPFNNQKFEDEQKEKQLKNKAKNEWVCQGCTFENDIKSKDCIMCGWDPKKPDEWICPQCTFKNNPRSYRCEMCQEGKKPEKEKQEKPKKEEKQEEKQNEFEKNQQQIPVEIRDKWNNEQKYIKSLLCLDDSKLSFQFDNIIKKFGPELKYIAGVDISFSQDVENLACSFLTVHSFPDMEIVYQDFEFVMLDMPYVSGFLAFREAAHLLNLFDKLFKNSPQFTPQVVMVDGNGVLHQNGCGLASHLGVLLDITTIGVGKTTFYVDGLTKDIVANEFQKVAQKKGDYSLLKGDSGRIWGAALKSEENVKNPIYVSVGHKIDIKTACELVQQCSKFRIPEPVRQADLISREKIRKMTEEEQNNASKTNKLVFLTDLYKEEYPEMSDDENNNIDKIRQNRKNHFKNKNNKYKKNRK